MYIAKAALQQQVPIRLPWEY